MHRSNTSIDESDDLSLKIQDFIKQNVYVLESFKKHNEDQDKPRQTISPIPCCEVNNSSFTPFYKIDENATLALKKITTKLINQLKLMIKPSKKVVYLCMSLVVLIGGQQQAFPPDILMSQDTEWNLVQSYLNQVNSIISPFSQFKELVRARKISMLNLKSSKHFFTLASNFDQSSINPQQDTIINNLSSIIPPLQNYIQESYHPSYQKKQKKKASSMSTYSLTMKEPVKESLIQQQEPDNQQEQQLPLTKTIPTKTVVKSVKGVHQRQVSMNSRTSISPNGSVNSTKRTDLQTRIMIAQQQKVSRLDKILGLRVKKPIVESAIKQQGTEKNTPKRRNDQKAILLEEISKNHEEINKLKRDELNFKWQIEREVKELQKVSEKERESDDITRYRQVYDQKHNFKNILQSFNRSPNRQEKFQSNKKSERSKENKSLVIQEYISQKQNEQFVLDLKNELLNSQRTKEEMQEKLLKTIYNCYQKSQYKENESFFEQ